MLFGIAVVALLVGAGLVWALMRGSVAAAGALARSESAAQLAALQATAEAAEREKATLRGQAAQFESLLDARRADISQLRQELGKAQAEAEQMAELRRALEEQRAGAEAAVRSQATLVSELKAEREKFDGQSQRIKEMDEAFTQRFELLATRILEEKTAKFTEHNGINLAQILDPFKEQLQVFKTTVETTHKEAIEKAVRFDEQVKQLHAAHTGLSTQAETLSRALTGGSTQKQGQWGELVLERVLQSSGLRKDHEYVTQFADSVDGEDSVEERFRPDVVIRLPDGRDIIVDAKVSLNAYTRFTAAESDAEREVEAKAHVAAVKARIAELASKPYEKLKKLRSLDLVFIFLPVEPAYILAAQREPSLFEDAFKQRILIAGPTTLLAMLRTVEGIWRIERQNQNASKIADAAVKIYDKLQAAAEDFEKVGRQIDGAQKTYQLAHNKLFSGNGNLIRQGEAMKQLGLKTKKAPSAQIMAEAGVEADELDEAEALPSEE